MYVTTQFLMSNPFLDRVNKRYVSPHPPRVLESVEPSNLLKNPLRGNN